MKEFWEAIQEFIKINSLKVISTIIIIVITFVILLFISIIIGRFIKKNKLKRRRASTLARLLQSIFRYVIVIISLMILLYIWGIDVRPILAGAGIIGIALGFGAQSLIRDFLSGMAIVFENYYDIDDVIEIKGFKGRCIEIGLKSTKIVNFKGELKIFSNGDINEVTNFSKNPSLAMVEIEISKKHIIENVVNLIDEKIGVVRDLFPQIIEGPNVLGVVRLSSRGYTIRITARTLSEEHYSVERGINRFIKELFDQNNIDIPYDHMVIHDE